MRGVLGSRALESFVRTVRSSCPPRVWSLGANLARQDLITFEHEDPQEVVLRIKLPHRPKPHTVVLYPEEEEWDCDCASKEDPCPHVAAAVITLKEARKKGAPLPISARKVRTLSYRLFRAGQALALERWIVDPKNEAEKLPSTLKAWIARDRSEVEIQLEDLDSRVDRLLGPRPPRILPTERVKDILGGLAGAPHVTLDGDPVKVGGEVLVPRARLHQEGEDLVFTIEKDPRLKEIVSQNVGRLGDTLHPLGESRLAGTRWEKLPLIERYPKARWAILLSEVIPLLKTRLPLKTEAKNVPEVVPHVRPRIDLGMAVRNGKLTLLPDLVYGRPPRVRIVDGSPVYVQGAIPERDHRLEERLLLRLRNELNLVPGRRVEFDGRETHRLLHKLQNWDAESHTTDEALDLDMAPVPLQPRLSFRGDTFDLTFEAESQDDDDLQPTRHADPMTVLDAWQNGVELVPLLEGGFAPLPSDWLETHGHRLSYLLKAREASGELPTLALPELGALAEALDAPPPPRLESLRPLLEDFHQIPSTPLPQDLQAVLRPYQEVGVNWLSFLRSLGLGAILADDMGLGKTVQAIAVFSGQTLIVCPTSVLGNWAQEITRFRPSLKVCMYHGTNRDIDHEADVIITSYAILRLDQSVFLAQTWDAVVLDEAQAIKNPQSQIARVAFSLDAKFRLSLTGTPVENRLLELWSQFHFTNPGLLGGRADFEEGYARAIAEGGQKEATALRARIRPFVLRRLKKEVAPELPPRTDVVLSVELSDEERVVYDTIRAATQSEIVQKLAEGGNVLAALEALLRLRQAACHPSLVPGQTASSSSKVETLLERLELVAQGGHRALVFSQWTAFLDLVEPKLQEHELPYFRLDGSTKNRAQLVTNFQKEDGPPILLISLRAGGTGLNLTAADHVFLLDPWWNPAVEDQAADRTHRIGQQKPVLVHRLVAKDTVEERILLLQNEKRRVADAALGEAGRAASIGRDDLLALLA